MERPKMAELESLETAAEHERILREIESTDTACIGPTLRCGDSGGTAGSRPCQRRLRGARGRWGAPGGVPGALCHRVSPAAAAAPHRGSLGCWRLLCSPSSLPLDRGSGPGRPRLRAGVPGSAALPCSVISLPREPPGFWGFAGGFRGVNLKAVSDEESPDFFNKWDYFRSVLYI